MEFLVLLIVTLVISLVTAALVLMMFRKSIDKILNRTIGGDISTAWRKFLTFALFVVGVANGVSLWRLEKFVQPVAEGEQMPQLTPEYWGLEIYRTVLGTLGGMAWALLLFFVIAMIAYVILRRGEMKAQS